MTKHSSASETPVGREWSFLRRWSLIVGAFVTIAAGITATLLVRNWPLLVKVLPVQVIVGLFVHAKHLPSRGQRDPFCARFPLTATGQPGLAILLDPLPPAPHRPIRYPKDFSRRPPGDLLGHGLQ